MKYIIFALLFATSTALGWNIPPQPKEAAYLAFKNKLVNPGFENGSSQWTNSGASFTITTTGADVGEGARSAVWDASAASQTLLSYNYTIEVGLRATNGLAQCRYRTDASDIVMQVHDGTNPIVEQTLPASSSYALTPFLNFGFPSSGTVRIRFVSASNSAAMYLDDCYLGTAHNVGTVSQAQLAGSAYFAQTTNCSWSRTNTAVGAFSTDADCPAPTIDKQVVGSWQTTDADLPRITINNLPPGLYKVTATASMYGGGDWTMAISDGTNTRGYASGSGNGAGTFQPANVSTAWFEYTSAGNRSFEIYGSSSSGSISLDNNQNNDRTTFVVERFPLGSESVVAADQGDYPWTSYTATISNFGTVSSQDCAHSRVSGDVLLRCRFVTSTGGAASEARVSLPGTLVSSSTIATLEHAGSLLMNATSVGVLATLIEPSVSYVVFSRDSATSNLTKVNGNTLAGSGFTYSLSARVPIQGWLAGQRAPQLIGSVTSSTTGREKIERLIQATACTSTPCTPTTQSGPWHGTTYTRSSTGQYSLTVSGWSDRPACICSYGENSTSGVCNVQVSSATTILVRVQDSAFGQADKPFSLICMGPR